MTIPAVVFIEGHNYGTAAELKPVAGGFKIILGKRLKVSTGHDLLTYCIANRLAWYRYFLDKNDITSVHPWRNLCDARNLPAGPRTCLRLIGAKTYESERG